MRESSEKAWVEKASLRGTMEAGEDKFSQGETAEIAFSLWSLKSLILRSA